MTQRRQELKGLLALEATSESIISVEEGQARELTEQLAEDWQASRAVSSRATQQQGAGHCLKRGAVLTLGTVAALLLVAHADKAVDYLKIGLGQGRVSLAAKLGCKTAEKGDDCYTSVVWAMRHRDTHPEWYIGLDNCSDFHDFQNFMHGQVLNSGGRRCPKPCEHDERTPPKGGDDSCHAKANSTKKKTTTAACHTAVPGDACYAHVIYTKSEAEKYPKWYPGISKDSKLIEVQYYLHTERVCPRPCVDQDLDKEDNITGCHTALPGDTCFADILLAKDKFIEKHPDWYKGLTNKSSKDEFQAFLHAQKHVDHSAEKKACPLPCNKTAMDLVNLQQTCRTPKIGDECYESVLWGATIGIKSHPQWYPDLHANSSFEEFQNHLHMNNDTKCVHPACPCMTPSKGDNCHKTIQWVRSEGLEAHPDRFAGLSKASTDQEVQQRLHEMGTSACGKPCATFDKDTRSPWRTTKHWF